MQVALLTTNKQTTDFEVCGMKLLLFITRDENQPTNNNNQIVETFSNENKL